MSSFASPSLATNPLDSSGGSLVEDSASPSPSSATTTTDAILKTSSGFPSSKPTSTSTTTAHLMVVSPTKPPRRRSHFSPTSAMTTSSTHYAHPVNQGLKERGYRPDMVMVTSNDDYEDDEEDEELTSTVASSDVTKINDNEMLRSPTEVLYAVSDKRRLHDQMAFDAHNDYNNSQGELGKYRKVNNSRNLESNKHDFEGQKKKNFDYNTQEAYDPKNAVYRRSGRPSTSASSQTLESSLRDSKSRRGSRVGSGEDFKARIAIRSSSSEVPKPFKTTINTATDNIVQHRGPGHHRGHGHRYYAEPRNAHYRVPRGPSQPSLNSTRLVRSVERGRQDHRELDREGRMIGGRGRTYSGCSTSPDHSPDRNNRRARSSPARDMIVHMMRRVHQGDQRRPNERLITSNKNPIRDILSSRQRAGNNEQSRLASFTEYKGDIDDQVSNDTLLESDRRSSRGRSLPPGANIGSMRDFYNSSQFKSMYLVPPSPSRPAPVLERAPSSSTLLMRTNQRLANNQKRMNRNSVSEPEINEPDMSVTRRTEGSNVARRPSNKRMAPKPPGMLRNSSEPNQLRRNARGLQQHPPVRRSHLGRRVSSEGHIDSSVSESDGLRADPRADHPRARVWALSTSMLSEEDTQQMDEDGFLSMDASTTDVLIDHDDDHSNIRHELEQLATLGRRRRPLSSMEAASLTRIPSTNPMHCSNTLGRLPRERTAAIIYDKTPTQDVQANNAVIVYKEKSRGRWTATQSDMDSDYRRDLALGPSGSSSMSLHTEARQRDNGPRNGRPHSSVEHRRRGRHHEDESRASAPTARSAHPRLTNKPSLTSSAGSSNETYTRSERRGDHHGSTRSVYLHSPCVVDIPAEGNRPRSSHRAQSAESRNRAPVRPSVNGGKTATRSTTSTLDRSKRLSRSISLLAPFRSRSNVRRASEIMYDNSAIYNAAKPPRPPSASRATSASRQSLVNTDDNTNSTNNTNNVDTLRRPQARVLIQPRDQQQQQRRQRGQQQQSSRTMLNTNESKVARSVSMPKDSKLAGFFRRKRKP